MLQMKSTMKVELNGRVYEFFCPPDAPLNDVYDALNQCLSFVIGRQVMANKPQQTPESVPCQQDEPPKG